MASFLDKFLSKEEQRKAAEFSRRAKKELSNLPVISAIGDSVQGASGLSELQKKLQTDSNNPKNWLFYYEANMMFKKMNNGVNVGRILINPIGFVAGKGISTGLNTLDDEYDKFDPKNCIGMTIALSMKNVKDKSRTMTGEDLVILSKAIAYSAVTSSDIILKEKMLGKSIQYISLAINQEKSKQRQGEYFFYLSQYYQFIGNEKETLRSLNISRKLGFKPAEKLLKTKLKSKMTEVNEKIVIDQYQTNSPYEFFELTYNPNLEDRASNTWEYVKEQQQIKFVETGKRISKFLERKF